jgi:hypothetical protein
VGSVKTVTLLLVVLATFALIAPVSPSGINREVRDWGADDVRPSVNLQLNHFASSRQWIEADPKGSLFGGLSSSPVFAKYNSASSIFAPISRTQCFVGGDDYTAALLCNAEVSNNEEGSTGFYRGKYNLERLWRSHEFSVVRRISFANFDDCRLECGSGHNLKVSSRILDTRRVRDCLLCQINSGKALVVLGCSGYSKRNGKAWIVSNLAHLEWLPVRAREAVGSYDDALWSTKDYNCSGQEWERTRNNNSASPYCLSEDFPTAPHLAIVVPKAVGD